MNVNTPARTPEHSAPPLWNCFIGWILTLAFGRPNIRDRESEVNPVNESPIDWAAQIDTQLRAVQRLDVWRAARQRHPDQSIRGCPSEPRIRTFRLESQERIHIRFCIHCGRVTASIPLYFLRLRFRVWRKRMKARLPLDRVSIHRVLARTVFWIFLFALSIALVYACTSLTYMLENNFTF